MLKQDSYLFTWQQQSIKNETPETFKVTMRSNLS